MKRKTVLGFALVGAMITAPALSHHAAEGIISDDIWQMINDNLLAIDSPHLNIDFDDVMGTMGSAEEGGRVFLTTTITVAEDDAVDYLLLIEEAVGNALDTAVADDMAPDGMTGSGNSKSFEVEVVPRDDDSGYVDVVLYELIGQGSSQEIAPPSASPGKRPNGG